MNHHTFLAFILIPLFLIACGGEDPDASLRPGSLDRDPPTSDSSEPDSADSNAGSTPNCQSPLIWGMCADGAEQCRYATGLVVHQRRTIDEDYVILDARCDFSLDGSLSFARRDLVIRFQSPDGLWVIRLDDAALRAVAPSNCELYVDCVLSAYSTVAAYLFESEGGPIKYAHDPGMIPGGTVRLTVDSSAPGSFVSVRLYIQLDDYVTRSGRITLDMLIEGSVD